MPEGIPGLVSPSSAKLDLCGLKRDLAKFHKVGISEPNIDWWHTFLEELEQQMGSIDSVDSWPLEKIIILKTQLTNRVRQQLDFDIQPTIANLTEQELSEIPEVKLLLYLIMIIAYALCIPIHTCTRSVCPTFAYNYRL